MFGIGVYPNIASESFIEIALFQNNTVKLFEAAIKAKNFYISCKAKGKLKNSIEKIFALKDEEITWPILEEKYWNSKNTSAWMKISEYLKLLKIPPILEFNYTKDHILEISYSKDFFLSYDIKHQNEIVEIMKEFDLNSNSMNIIFDEINELIRNYHKIFNSLTIQNCIYCPSSESYNLKMDIKTMKINFPKINWNDFLEIIFQRKFHDLEIVYVKHYLKTMPYLEMISNTNYRILTNYMILKLIKQLRKLETDENEDCALQTFNKFDSVMLALYSQILFNDYHRKQYLEIIKIFKESFEQSKCRYNSTTTLNDLEFILKTEIDYIRNLDNIFKPEKLNNDYELVQITANNYYQNLITLGNYKSCALYEQDCLKKVNTMVFIFEIASMYNKPLYYSFIDKYFSLWDKLIRNIFNYGWNSEKYENAKLCANIQSSIQKFSISKSDSTQSIIINTILKQVFNDFKKWLYDIENYSEYEEIFNEFNLTSKKAFFINFVQAHCNQEEKHRATIHQSLLNMNEFSREFKCSNNDSMNPLLKCEIF